MSWIAKKFAVDPQMKVEYTYITMSPQLGLFSDIVSGMASAFVECSRCDRKRYIRDHFTKTHSDQLLTRSVSVLFPPIPRSRFFYNFRLLLPMPKLARQFDHAIRRFVHLRLWS